MKVGILTWYKAVNHGAVLQTYASCKVLESMNVAPVVLDFKWVLNDNKTSNKLIRYVKKFSIRQVLWHIKVKKWKKEKKMIFESFIRSKLPLGNAYNIAQGLDAVYIGSDMVFDFSAGYNPFMYGIEVPVKYIFAYAASFGYSTLDMLKNFPYRREIVSALKKFKAIGYRDQNTLDIVNYYNIDVPVSECIDPVLLYGFKNEVETWDSGKWRNKKYIAIYSYDSTMNEPETVNQIKDIAQFEGLEIVSCGYYHRWCDNCIQASPEEFVEILKHATYVITDTFHGTVFSAIMHKQFASIIRKNGFKLKYLLQQSSLNDRICCENNSMQSILHNKVDYRFFDSWLEEKRAESKKFINENIEAAQ